WRELEDRNDGDVVGLVSDLAGHRLEKQVGQVEAHDGVAIGRQAVELRPSHGSTGPRLILDDEPMAGELLEARLLQARSDVRFPSGVEGNDVGDILRRPIRCDGGAGQNTGRDNSRGSGTEYTGNHFFDFLLVSDRWLFFDRAPPPNRSISRRMKSPR